MITKRMDLFGSSKQKNVKDLPATKVDKDTGRVLYLNIITGEYE